MDEKVMIKMLNEMKNVLINQLKNFKKAIKDSMRIEIKTSEDSIRKEIMDVKSEVNNQKTETEELKIKMNNIEQKVMKEESYANVLKKQPPIAEKKDSDNEKIEHIMMMAKRRVGIQPVTLEDINRVASKEEVRGKEALKLTVNEFLTLELQLDDEEMKQLGDLDVHRKDDNANEKVYLTF